MPTLRFEPGGDEARAQPGDRLLDAGLDGGLAMPFGCQSAKCGVCRVEVLGESATGLEEPSDLEALTLASFRCPPGVRLACQARVRGDVIFRSAHPEEGED